MSTIGGQNPLGNPVISGTSSTCQRGGHFKHGILRVCEFLSWRPQTRHIGTSWQGHHDAVYKNDLGCTLHVLVCTCAPADAPQCFVSRERPDGLCLNVVRGYRFISYEFYTTQWWGASARAHVRTPFPYLGNGWTDCAEIWYVVRDQLARLLTQNKGGDTSARAHLRTCRCARFPYLGSCLTDCAEIR